MPPLCCRPARPQVRLALALELPGSRQYALTLKDTTLAGNRFNATGAAAVQGSASVTVKLVNSGESSSCAAPRCARWGSSTTHALRPWAGQATPRCQPA